MPALGTGYYIMALQRRGAIMDQCRSYSSSQFSPIILRLFILFPMEIEVRFAACVNPPPIGKVELFQRKCALRNFDCTTLTDCKISSYAAVGHLGMTAPAVVPDTLAYYMSVANMERGGDCKGGAEPMPPPFAGTRGGNGTEEGVRGGGT